MRWRKRARQTFVVSVGKHAVVPMRKAIQHGYINPDHNPEVVLRVDENFNQSVTWHCPTCVGKR